MYLRPRPTVDKDVILSTEGVKDLKDVILSTEGVKDLKDVILMEPKAIKGSPKMPGVHCEGGS